MISTQDEDDIFSGPVTKKELEKIRKVQKRLERNKRKTIAYVPGSCEIYSGSV